VPFQRLTKDLRAAVSGCGLLRQQNLTPDRIAARHIEAVGGIDKIHALKSLVIRGMSSGRI
jgi:hypothetical protein